MPIDGMPTLEPEAVDRVLGQVLKAGQLDRNSAVVQALVTEVHRAHAQACNQMTFASIMAGDAAPAEALLQQMVAPPTPAYPAAETAPAAVETGAAGRFAEARQTVQALTFYNQPEVITAMTRVQLECSKVLPMRLFCTTITKSMKLEDFQAMQQQNYDAVQGFLRNQWVPNVKRAIEHSLSSFGKGWFNLKEQSQEVYDVSKLRRLMMLVRLTMQDALRSLVLKSLRALTSLVEEAGRSVLDAKPLTFQPNTLFVDKIFVCLTRPPPTANHHHQPRPQIHGAVQAGQHAALCVGSRH
jgi:dynein heavy chain